MTQTTTTTPTCSKTVKRGFPGIPCIKCGNDGAVITVDLDDVSTFRCAECEDEFTADDVREMVAGWSKVLAWLDLAPEVEQ